LWKKSENRLPKRVNRYAVASPPMEVSQAITEPSGPQKCCCETETRRTAMHSIIYIVGLVVIVVAILSFLGLG
jgi:hypothetical protein